MLTSEETQHHANGNVTVGTIAFISESSTHTYFVGKVGGVIACTKHGYKFYTKEEARKNAIACRQFFRDALVPQQITAE